MAESCLVTAIEQTTCNTAGTGMNDHTTTIIIDLFREIDTGEAHLADVKHLLLRMVKQRQDKSTIRYAPQLILVLEKM